MTKEQKITYAKIIIPLLLLILSISCSGVLSSPEFHAKTIRSLDEKKQNVTLMLATTAAVSNMITMLPDDMCTPLADEVADLTSYLLLITCVLYVEKYLVTICGWAVFKFVIPFACVLWIFEDHFPQVKKHAAKIAMTGLLFFLLVPVSEHVSGMITDTYKISLEENMQETKSMMGDIQENTEENADGSLKAIWNKIKGGVTGTVEKIGNSMDKMVDSVAVMIVTSCVIPLVTLFISTKILSLFMGINITINLPKRRGRSKRRKQIDDKKAESVIGMEEVDVPEAIEEKTSEEE